ncbi:hypothetical protein [Chitinophaga caseinilytica]|uniref:hypothetical protein n=1 Tax=Chitinophaga caseinilytica TaxID=2267521 RepID=UPI003C2B2FD6
MAIVESTMEVTGRLGEFVYYRRKGTDKIIMRRCNGPSKERIKTDGKFARTRENNAEFKACNMFAASVRRPMIAFRQIADPNYTGRLVKLAKEIQLRDAERPRGERGICLSANKALLRGFNFNKEYPFDSLLQHPVTASANRAAGTVTLSFPAIMPDINLSLPWKLPFYRFVVYLAMVGDIVFRKELFEPGGAPAWDRNVSEWQHRDARAEGFDMQLSLDVPVLADASLIVAVGIEMGMPDGSGELKGRKYAGGAKVLEVF